MFSTSSFRKVIFAALIFLTFVPSSTGQAQTANKNSSDHQTLQELAVKFFAACRELNWDTLKSLSSNGDLEKLPVSRERLEKWSNRDRYDFSSPIFSRFKQGGAQASLRMTVTFNWRDWKTNQPRPTPQSFNFSFVRENDGWKVTYFDAATKDLLNAFLASRSVDEEKRVLEQERELLNSREILTLFTYFSGLNQKENRPQLDRFLKAIESNKNNPEGVCNALWWLGHRAFERGDFHVAETEFKKAIRLAEETRDTWLLACSYTDIAQTYVNLGDEESAQKFQQQGLEIFLKDPKDYEDAISHQRAFANAYYNDRSYEKARDNYKKGQSLAREAQDKEWEIVFIQDIGDTYYGQEDIPNALSWYQQALDTFTSLPKSPLKIKNDLSIWQIHQSIGAAFQKQKNFPQALTSFRNAREAASEMKDATGISSSFRATGDYYLSIKDITTALDYYTQMIDRLNETNSLANCDDCLVDIIGALVNRGVNANQVEIFLSKILDKYESHLPIPEVLKLRELKGAIYLKGGENAKAEDEFIQLLRRHDVDDDLRAEITFLLGSVYMAQGQLDAAWRYIIQAEALEERLNDKEVADLIKSQKALLMAAFLENGSRSIQTLQQLVAQSTDKEFLSVAHAFLGILYLANDDDEEALDNARKSLEHLDPKDEFQASLISLSMMNISLILSQSGQHQDALQAAQQASSIAKRLNLYFVLRQSKALEGLSHYKLHQLPQAREALGEAIKLIEERRNEQAGGIEGVVSYFESMITPYETMLDVLYELKDYDAAVNLIESSKARALLDILSRGSVNKPAVNSPAFSSSPFSSTQKDGQGNVGAAVPAELSGQTSTLHQVEMKSLLPDPSTALLQYAVTDEYVYLFLFTDANKGRVNNLSPTKQNWREGVTWKVYRFDISREALEEEVNQMAEVLSDNRSGYSTHCQKLYKLLLEPAAADLANKTSLIIIPDGVLWGVPFQALQPSEDHFLLEDFAVSYAPSMAVLYKMMHSHHVRQLKPRVAGVPEILALANSAETVQKIEINPVTANEIMITIGTPSSQPPVFNRAQIRRYAILKPLPGATDEVNRLVAIYGSRQVKLLTGPSLTKETF
jgi:tetratricopeptide (TPR) repeat protein